MNSQERINFSVIFCFILFFLLITTVHYSYDETLKINQFDGESYYNISLSYVKDINLQIPFHHAQRFFFPSLVGQISKLIQFDIFLLYKIIVLIFFGLSCLIIYKIILSTNLNFLDSITVLSILLLNPYLVRYHISVPTMLNDMAFIFSCFLFLYAIKFSSAKLIFLSCIISLLSRQTGLFICIASIIYFFKEKKYLYLILTIIFFILVFNLSKKYAISISDSQFNFAHLTGLFNDFLNLNNFKFKIIWLFLPLICFFPVIVFLILRNNMQLNYNYKNIILIFLILSITGISYLAGPTMAGRNILRQVAPALPFLLFLIIDASQQNKMTKLKKNMNILLIILCFIFSMHPTYSIINFFKIV